MNNQEFFQSKVTELSQELSRHGMWQKVTPDWVHHYNEQGGLVQPDFFEWLQFVYIPNMYMLRKNTGFREDGKYIMLEAREFMNQNCLPESVVRIMVEIDNIIMTNETSEAQ